MFFSHTLREILEHGVHQAGPAREKEGAYAKHLTDMTPDHVLERQNMIQLVWRECENGVQWYGVQPSTAVSNLHRGKQD